MLDFFDQFLLNEHGFSLDINMIIISDVWRPVKRTFTSIGICILWVPWHETGIYTKENMEVTYITWYIHMYHCITSELASVCIPCIHKAEIIVPHVGYLSLVISLVLQNYQSN